MVAWTNGKLWKLGLSKYWEGTGFMSFVKFSPVVYAALQAAILFAADITPWTVFLSTLNVVGGFLLAIPIVTVAVAVEKLNEMREENIALKKRINEIDERCIDLTRQNSGYQARLANLFEDYCLKDEVGQFKARTSTIYLNEGAVIDWHEVSSRKIEVGQALTWRGHTVEIMTIQKKNQTGAYGVQAKVVKEAYRVNFLDEIDED